MGRCGGWWRRAALVLSLALWTSSGAVRADVDVDVVARRGRAHDIVVAGGIDGRVIAMNAWTGDVLWVFDSGGPMVDSSDCGAGTKGHGAAWQTTSSTLDGDAKVEDRHKHTGAAVATQGGGALSSVALSQMIPSYDGRLYHIDGKNVREIEMSMVDIINANGPVRLSAQGDGQPDELADLLLFGEKQTKIFSLDAVQGMIQPFVTSHSGVAGETKPTILFGRAEFKTKAVHARNMSAARCFTISEYFLQFTEQATCSMAESGTSASAPHILVVPKDPEAMSDEEDESTIIAYDPWTNKQLWERPIPQFDVIAAFGVSMNRGSSFFKWNIDGPSSTAAMHQKRDERMLAGAANEKLGTTPQLITQGEDQEATNESNQLVKVVQREWPSMESQFRLRLFDGNYYLEHNEDEHDTRHSSSASSSFGNTFGRDLPNRNRRVFWESMESNGKKGVFISYYHVGAMTFGAVIGCMLIAWGFYVKGLSASDAFRTIEHNPFLPSGHIHQLTIEQPGRETITISSSITRSLLLDAAASFGYSTRQGVPLLENGEQTGPSSSNKSNQQIQLDPETEAMLMEKFSKMVALEAAAALAGSRLSATNLMQLECDPDSSNTQAVTATTYSSNASTMTSSSIRLLSDSMSPSGRPHRLSFLADDGTLESVAILEDTSVQSNMTEDDEGRFVPVIEELECSSSESLSDEKDFSQQFELTNEDESAAVNTANENTRTSAHSEPKSTASAWDSETTGSSNTNSGSSSGSSDEASGSSSGSSASTELNSRQQLEDDTTRESVSLPDTSNPRKVSDASSSSSTPNEAEVLFPFVCQSRFANEFVELSALGKGGFGQVMLAENRLDGRKYAIKRVGLHLKNQTSKTLQKFLREVKILALLDHPNIVRYYQAWLEKVEEGTMSTMSTGSDATGTVPPRNYSMSNLLAPISEMDFSNQQRSMQSFYSNGSFGDDGGFEWERNSADGTQDAEAWREEDLTESRNGRQAQRIIEPNPPPKARGTKREVENDEDSSCYSNDRCDHWLYIQMQYCAGRNLGDYLAIPNRSMELPKLFKIFTQIASAIAHVHSCGLIHRDLKPANIFVADTEGDSIKLGDFGLSRYAANVNLTTSQTTVVEEHATAFMSGGVNGMAQYSMSKWSVSVSNMSESQDITAGVGTYLYASPEQVAGKKYNAKTDMYSLGMILFELCHERFTTTMERYMTLRNARDRNFPSQFQWRKKCPEIMMMLDRLLHHDPMARPDAAEVVQWSQELYEMSLAQHHHAASNGVTMMRSPIHQPRSFHGAMPTLNIDGMTSAFSLQVEARTESNAEDGGERRLPNHNLLKEICDVIAEISGGRTEIKKCGLHIQDEGAQVLDFVLDPHLSDEEKGAGDEVTVVLRHKQDLVKAIEALPGVHTVRLDV